jgi:hypothetical protein
MTLRISGNGKLGNALHLTFDPFVWREWFPELGRLHCKQEHGVGLSAKPIAFQGFSFAGVVCCLERRGRMRSTIGQVYLSQASG